MIPLAKRVQRVAQDLLPHAAKWNPRAKAWKWDITVIKTPAINALCMPGGKIAVFTGILDALKLTDDELAVVLGHEMAHALREHARARAAKVTLTNVGTLGDRPRSSAATSASLPARAGAAGFEVQPRRRARCRSRRPGAGRPRGLQTRKPAFTLWQKMTQAAKGAPPTWLSTHPSGDDRERRTKAALKDVMPLYEKARASKPPPTAPTAN
jgi:Zn-dependent protease with chaperone function